MRARNTTPIEDIPFPKGAKVRIAIGGLAYCKLATFISEINFLSHVPLHELRMKIVKRNFDTGKVMGTVDPPKTIKYGNRIFIESSTAIEPDEIEADDVANEFELEEIVNVSDLHDVRMVEINPPEVAKPTSLLITKCAYYTLEMSANKYKIVRVSRSRSRRKAAPQDIRFNRYIGYRLGGKIFTSTDDSLTVISSKDLGEIKLEGVNNKGIRMAYDIEFTNHCEKLPECKLIKDPDFRYYYNVLIDPKNKDKKFDIEVSRGTEAACNPVIIDPPEW